MLKALINKFQRHHDAQDFTEIVKACQSDLRNYCRRLTAGDIALADDIAQDSLITAYQQLGKLNNVVAFKSWLYRIAYRKFLMHISKQKETLTSQYEPLKDNVEDPSYGEQQFENEQILVYLMQFLSKEQRAVITLHFSLGYSQSEISNILDMPLGTVKSHCQRGKETMVLHSHKQQLGAA